MKKALIAALTILMVATMASAQMGGGHHGNPGQGRGPEAGGPMGGHLIVADNGYVIVTRVVTDSATNTSSVQLVAITPSGSQAWTSTLTGGRGGFTLSGNNLLTVSSTAASDGTVSSTITARSVTTGATAWTLTRNGHITDLEPFSGGTYAVVVVPPTTAGGTATRTLIAISASGTVSWSVNL